MKRSEVDINKVTPMMRQYLDVKEQNPNVIIFFRLGDFYEMFFEDAILASRVLELTLTGKNAGLDEKIPMCGIPHHASSIYIEKLVKAGYRVGICEQMEDAKNTKGIVRRDIVQIVSSGTVITNESLNEKENNYIGSVIDFKHAFGVAYIDITTGELKTTLIDNDYSKLISMIVNLDLKEVVVSEKLNKEIISILEKQFKITVSYSDQVNEYEMYKYLYQDIVDIRYVEAIKHLLTYLNNTQKRDLTHLQKAIVIENSKILKMDIHTKRNLELTETIRLKERTYSLLWLLDKTKTAMGSRMLKQYIESPLVDKEEINNRYTIVSKLLEEFILKEELQQLLYNVYDLERLSGRISFGNANARDLLQLKTSLKVLPDIKNILENINFDEKIETLNDLYNLLEESIYEEPPFSIKEGYLIKKGYNDELDSLKELRSGGKDFVARFEATEREKTGIKNLKIGYNRVFGYYIEVSKGNVNLVKDEYGYERRQTLSNCERYISPILKEQESLILNAEEKIVELEYELFIKIRDQIKLYIPKLQMNAKTISKIDVLASFATVSEENNYVKPTITDDRVINIVNSRHPIIERVSNNLFVPNDIVMDSNNSILLITGPNMAGKSTYMRQIGITAIMAQIGCFVPASEAKLPIFDAIFTRIGASDDLVSGESTFMVEMIEANNAILNATSNSLILFDELGRGTATFDGMALAQAIIEYIHDFIKAKTFFSTHYHELTDLDKHLTGLRNIHASAYEDNGNVTFLHKIKEGSVDKSYGIHVAKLAHLPDSLIKRATEILHVYENVENKRDIKIQEKIVFDDVVVKSDIEKELDSINPLEITPLDALNLLYNLKNKIKK